MLENVPGFSCLENLPVLKISCGRIARETLPIGMKDRATYFETQKRQTAGTQKVIDLRSGSHTALAHEKADLGKY